MGYEEALKKAWDDLGGAPESDISVRFLADEYILDTKNRSVHSLSCNVPAKDYTSVIILHYIAKKLKLKALPKPYGEWIDFKDLEGGEIYYPIFKKRTIDRIASKFGRDHDAFRSSVGRYPSRAASIGDTSFIVDTFTDVPILIALYGQDEEFGPGANILFDRSISEIFVTEDIVVLTEILTHSL
ncbi:MAG TPA: DUF3786 domain-containing protein [Candidatus Omnitrophota bacterium]|nr:DUF3786 domain-containing protein [Candidatus Omnitrophota bacterium]